VRTTTTSPTTTAATDNPPLGDAHVVLDRDRAPDLVGELEREQGHRYAPNVVARNAVADQVQQSPGRQRHDGKAGQDQRPVLDRRPP
jgi:hypothetical protein